MDSASEAPPISESFETLVWERLQGCESISEYELMQHLCAAGWGEFKPSLDELAMFRAHFLLFHLLYRLQDRWLNQGRGRLSIHTTAIYVHTQPSNLSGESDAAKSAGLSKSDPLKAYYLDYNEFLTTQKDDVLSLLEDFWLRLAGQTPVSLKANTKAEALQTLGMEHSAYTPQSVKQRFRTLSQQHHPDKGGDAHEFRQICEARDILLASLDQP
ncbi:MAG: DNA-J related domain-containing protein [Thiomicrorhabdus chilensis]|uniref:DNA-J related domain-containing protein n=1 Tax=Thiomicrorhabdus chilensis TaxID=63656 RepID=UPI00299F1729|nr:DNA-J related domain-containing protein [Thiomicrorhabdus chilensis]MDX1346987.1 DNA-J related domain-containing protein [Thiomicrorhabdus chilensis]